MSETRLGAPTKRLLTMREAADYCGLGVAVFHSRCPVPPIVIEARVVRYDIRALDAWIDRMNGSRMLSNAELLARL